jgi:hypothetical protein
MEQKHTRELVSHWRDDCRGWPLASGEQEGDGGTVADSAHWQQFPLRGRSPALLCGRYFFFPGVVIRKVFGRFLGMVDRVVTVSCSNFRVERGLLVIACFVMLRRFAMVLCCEFVMFGCLLVVLSTLLSCHVLYSSLNATASLPGGSDQYRTAETPRLCSFDQE